jgi:REP element-mobilizing transposase RayT
VVLTGIQARAVARGFATICQKIELAIYACSILPDHVHLVVAAHQLDGNELIACLKRAGTRGMNDEGLHPLRAFARKSGKHPSPWAERGWKVMLFTTEQMHAAIRYVEQNPIRAGLRPQRWSFLVPYAG